jgi:hypothetical protein
MPNRNAAATTIQRKWRQVRPYHNPLAVLNNNAILGILSHLPNRQNQKRFLNAIRPPTSLNRTVRHVHKKKNVKREELLKKLYQASRRPRVAPQHENRLIQTFKRFQAAKNKLAKGGKITWYGGDPVTYYSKWNRRWYNYSNEAKERFNDEYKNIMRHLMAPNSNYTNNRYPMHMRRFAKFILNNHRGEPSNLNSSPNNLVFFHVNGVPVYY